MGNWIKEFIDGTKYVATDKEVAAGRVSWKNSRQDGIVAVSLEHCGKLLRIEGLGEYWQSDQMFFDFSDRFPKCTARRIQRKVKPQDLFMGFLEGEDRLVVRFSTTPDGRGYVPVPQEWLNQWAVLEVSTVSLKTKYYFSVDKI